MVYLNWIAHVQRVWLVMGVVLSSALTTVLSACPKNVSTKANSCFTSYSFQFQIMQNSPNKLCCGVDVEILRAFCQSYNSAMGCVNQLKRDCPEDTYHTIDKTLSNLSEVREELHELCSDDSIIENYAMYQTCFTQEGFKSERCLQTHMNITVGTNIKFLSSVPIRRMDQFCKDMRKTVECVQSNVEMVCGEEAAQLVHVLIKPMIRQSADCDYSVINDQQKESTRLQHGQGTFINGDKTGSKRISSNNNRGKNGSGDLAMMSVALFVTAFSSPFLCSLVYI